MHDGVAEAAFVEQLKRDLDAVRQRPLVGADDDRRQVQLGLVDQPGAERLAASSGPAILRSRSDSTFMRRTASGSNSRSTRVRAVDAARSVRE
jgi:hypothetical protein